MSRAIPVLREGSTVMVRRAGAVEPGLWQVLAQIANSDRRDPAYEIVRVEDGRRRISRRSQLLLWDPAGVSVEGGTRR